MSTLATEATVSTLATEATVATLATEATVSTLATEATVATLATEATLSNVEEKLNYNVYKLATEKLVSWSDYKTLNINGYLSTGTGALVVSNNSNGFLHPLSTAEKFKIVSDNVNDTIAGTGLKTVKVDGLNNAYNPLSEIVEMDGSTDVETVANFRHVHKITPITSGANIMNEGAITVRNQSNIIYGRLNAGGLGSFSGWFMCPADTTAVLYNLSVRSSNANTIHIIVLRKDQQPPTSEKSFNVLQNELFSLINTPITSLNEGDSVYFYQGTSAETYVSMSFALN